MKNKTKSKKKGKSVFILGDCMVKHLNGWETSKKIKNCKVHVRSFPTAKAQWTDGYKKPSIRDKPDHFIIHVGTNDLNSQIPSKPIAESIVDIAMCLIDDTKKFRFHYLNKDKLHLSREGSELSHDLSWQI